MTLRQYNQEKWEERNSSALADMVAPLQLGMGTATTGMKAIFKLKKNFNL